MKNWQIIQNFKIALKYWLKAAWFLLLIKLLYLLKVKFSSKNNNTKEKCKNNIIFFKWLKPKQCSSRDHHNEQKMQSSKTGNIQLSSNTTCLVRVIKILQPVAAYEKYIVKNSFKKQIRTENPFKTIHYKNVKYFPIIQYFHNFIKILHAIISFYILSIHLDQHMGFLWTVMTCHIH